MFRIFVIIITLAPALNALAQYSSPYRQIGVNGYIGDDHRHADPFNDIDARKNPLFRGFAGGYVNYLPAGDVWPQWTDAASALGPATGEHYHIVSLGDLNQSQIDAGAAPGEITLTFNEPNNIIRDKAGYDFVIFENGAPVEWPTDPGLGFVAGEIFAELAYVEVSTDGVNYVRFPAVSLTPELTGPYGSLNPNNLYNFAGKHINNNGICTGTPFDLDDIQTDPKVLAGQVDPNNIRFVRIIDIPGNGSFQDNAVSLVDPNSDPDWNNYSDNHPIYDAWETWGSGGFDLEAVGVLRQQEYAADINLDGIVDMNDLYRFNDAWLSRLGQPGYLDRCDLAKPRDYVINWRDFTVLAEQWYRREKWR